MNAHRLPARLTAEQTAEILGFQLHDIHVLVAAKLLQPLGSPAANAPKYFATVVIEALAENADWLARATRTLTKHWAEKNSKRRRTVPVGCTGRTFRSNKPAEAGAETGSASVGRNRRATALLNIVAETLRGGVTISLPAFARRLSDDTDGATLSSAAGQAACSSKHRRHGGYYAGPLSGGTTLVAGYLSSTPTTSIFA